MIDLVFFLKIDIKFIRYLNTIIEKFLNIVELYTL